MAGARSFGARGFWRRDGDGGRFRRRRGKDNGGASSSSSGDSTSARARRGRELDVGGLVGRARAACARAGALAPGVQRVTTAAALGASFVGASGDRGRRRTLRGRRSNDVVGGLFTNPDRLCTDAIMVGTVGAYALQILSGQALTALGAKVNERIAAGQIWRFVTPMLLHGGVPHLLVNMYSLNSIGPMVEATFGREQFMATYVAAGATGNYASYRFCASNSVGASGAIFGVAGALAVYLHRHRRYLGERADMQLRQLGTALAVNMGFGLTNPRIDNWGHGGGLLGGAALAYLTGPNLMLESDDPRGLSMRRKLVNRPKVQSALRAVKDFWDEDDEDDDDDDA